MATQELVAADVTSIVRRYIDAFNEGDVKGRAAAFAVPGLILDGMRPHAWQGTTAAQDWYRDVLINTKKEGASDLFRHAWDTATHGDYRGCCISCGSRDYEVQSPR